MDPPPHGTYSIIEDNRAIVKIFYLFLNIFYTNTIYLSIVYTLTSNNDLHDLLDIAQTLDRYKDIPLLQLVIEKMTTKFVRY